MRISRSTGPTRCRLCLQDADAEVARHIREMTPCTQPGCPLKDVIDTALEQRRMGKTIRFGMPYKPPKPRIGKAITLRAGSPMMHVLKYKPWTERLQDSFNSLIRRIKRFLDIEEL
jgi:hypothetical protein